MPLRPLKSDQAFTLIEALMALGIIGIVAAGVAFQIKSLQDTRYRIEAISTRDTLNLRIRRTINLPSLVFSAQVFKTDGNRRLLACIDDDATTICDSTDITRQEDFILAYPQGPNGQIVSGDDASPAGYSHNGEYCSGTNKCRVEWESRTYFNAVCPNGTPSCPKAAYARVRFQLRPRNDAFNSPIPPYPSDQEFKNPAVGLISINLKSDAPDSACNPGSVIIKVGREGAVTCACLPGSIPSGMKDGQPICTPTTIRCPDPNETPLGLDKNLKPICRRNVTCRQKSMEEECNGYINSIFLAGCYSDVAVAKKKKSDTNTEAACPTDIYMCCEPL